jgi:hypothetical protein
MLSGPAEMLLRRGRGCRQAGRAIPELAAGDTVEVDPEVTSHVSQCLHCQAEVAEYKRMLRTLHALRRDTVPAPPGSLPALLAALDEVAGRPAAPLGWGLRAACFGGLTAAAGAAGVLVWMSRRRPGLARAG